MPLRVMRHPEQYIGWRRTNHIWEHPERLRRVGIERVTADPDVIFLGADHDLPFAWLDVPVIVENTHDCATLTPEQLKILENPRVVSCFRNILFKRPELYTSPVWQKSALGYKVLGYLDPGQAARLPEQPWSAAYEKLRLVYHTCGPAGPPDELLWATGERAKPLHDRPIDVCFIGRMKYSPNPTYPEAHRSCLKAVWDSLPGKKDWVQYDLDNKPLPRPEFYERLAQAKIVISPWGWGAWNVRDIEAMICKSVVIKPRCDEYAVYPDFLTGKRMVFCSPDFCDLRETVKSVLNNLPAFEPPMQQGYHVLREQLWPVDKLVAKWAEATHQVMQELRPWRPH